MDKNTVRVQYSFEQWKPVVEYKTLERVKIGSWFFGLFSVYKYFWSDWKQN